MMHGTFFLTKRKCHMMEKNEDKIPFTGFNVGYLYI